MQSSFLDHLPAPEASETGGEVGHHCRAGQEPRHSRADTDRIAPHALVGAATSRGDVPFAAEVGERGRLLCTPILSSDVATFLRGAGRDELMKRVGQRGHLAKPAHATTLLFCLEDR